MAASAIAARKPARTPKPAEPQLKPPLGDETLAGTSCGCLIWVTIVPRSVRSSGRGGRHERGRVVAGDDPRLVETGDGLRDLREKARPRAPRSSGLTTTPVEPEPPPSSMGWAWAVVGTIAAAIAMTGINLRFSLFRERIDMFGASTSCLR